MRGGLMVSRTASGLGNHAPFGRAQRVLFFFQAEDGIRYLTVTGVQTCALPISASPQYSITWPVAPSVPIWPMMPTARSLAATPSASRPRTSIFMVFGFCCARHCVDRKSVVYGKRVDLGGRRIIKKKIG